VCRLALVDLLLPDMKGWDVVQRIKERWPDTRVAVVSGLAVGRDDPDRGKADAVFRKPIDTEELLAFLGL
jgi:DNA-binding response OmpR family regulator